MKQHILRKTSIVVAGLFLYASGAWANNPVATANASGSYIDWSPNVSSAIVLEVTNGFEFAYREVFKDSTPSFSTTHEDKALADGQYTYQLTGSANGNGSSVRQSGTFEVAGGMITLDESSAED